jgi:hypothetical protein
MPPEPAQIQYSLIITSTVLFVIIGVAIGIGIGIDSEKKELFDTNADFYPDFEPNQQPPIRGRMQFMRYNTLRSGNCISGIVCPLCNTGLLYSYSKENV